MVTLLTKPKLHPTFKGETGAERAAKRLAWMRTNSGVVEATRETRQNYRHLLHKAKKGMKP